MEFVNQFVVSAPADEAWEILTDVPRMVPCLPGASARELPNGEFEGNIAIKVGPIKVSYGGVVAFLERDADKHAMVLDARGQEKSGKGSANAIIRVNLAERDARTTVVDVITELQITGKIAQFGRSAMADVGERMIGQFAANLEALITGDSGVPQHATGGSPTREQFDSAAQPPAQPATEFDGLSLMLPLLRRVAPVAGAFVVGAIVGKLVFGRGRSSTGFNPYSGFRDPGAAFADWADRQCY